MRNRVIYQQWAAILLIAISSFFWKINLFPHNNILVGDIGRDMLAGHIILEKNLLISEGHTNSGINSNYPSIYYYFISFLTAIGNNQYSVIAYLLILYQSIGIILLFLLVKNSFSFFPAVIVGIFYAFSFIGTNLSLFPVSANNSIPIILLSAIFLQIGMKKNNLIYFVLSGILLVLAATFFYGAMLFFPLYLGLIAIKTVKREKFLKSLLPSIIFTTVFFVFLIILFSKTLDYRYLHYKLIGSGFYNLQTGIHSLQIGQQSLGDTLNKIYYQVWRLHPKFTFLIYPVYLISIVVSLKNKKIRKQAVLFLSIIFAHILLYIFHQNTLEHYLIYMDFLLIYAWGFILQQALNRKKIIFVILSLIFIYSGNLLHNYNHINSNSYQHYQKANQVITQKYPEASIINWDHCNDEGYGKRQWKFGDEPWESRIFWYFQKEKPSFFELSNKLNNIGLLNKSIVFVCYVYEGQLKENINLKKETENGLAFDFQVDDKVYSVYSYEK